ncbi:MAG TPA: hypothetical protein VGE52_06650 [Pirellulales bacterium]
MPARHPYAPGWTQAKTNFTGVADIANVDTKFTRTTLVSDAKGVDKALIKLDDEIVDKDKEAIEKAYLDFLKKATEFKKKFTTGAKKLPQYGNITNAIKTLFQYLGEVQGDAEIHFQDFSGKPKADLEKSWNYFKKKFEAATGKKKPTESVAKIFRKPSGIGKVLAEADKAALAGQLDKVVAARKRYLVVKNDYVRTLVNALADSDAESDYHLELEMLKSSLDEIEGKFGPIEGALGGG